MWLNELKTALVLKDIEKLNTLLDSVPPLDKQTDIQEAIYLLDEAKKVVLQAQDELLSSMQKIKKNIEFLNATKPQDYKNLNIIS